MERSVIGSDHKTNSVNSLSPRMARRLAARTPLSLDPRRSFAIKRSVHELEVSTDARTFARALHEVVTEPGASFGLVRLKRPAHRTGLPFAAGERFHGALALGRKLPILDARLLAPLARWLEDRFLSDYAEIEEMSLDPAAGEPFRLRYRYLEGTPLAGRTTMTIEPLAALRCRFTQVFEFQEVRGAALGALHRFALKRHDQATHVQVERAAARAGARILRSTIAPAYMSL